MNLNNHILNLADQCVKCGMCLPHCPTYVNSQLESESPRGRIAIIQGLLLNKISHNQHTLDHINNCLSCRACEKVCPSNVEYGRLMDDFKYSQSARLLSPFNQIKKTLIRILLLNTILKQFLLKLLTLLRLEYTVGMPSLVIKHKQSQYYNSKQTNYPSNNASFQHTKKTIAVFIGCTGNSFDRSTLNDVIFVLTQIGFDVRVIKKSHCCGAMDAHAGRKQAAKQHALENINAVTLLNVDQITYFATGCGAQLIDYQHINWDTEQQSQNAQNFTSKLIEISKLIHLFWPSNIKLKPLKTSIAIHEPCSHRNVITDSVSVKQLLNRIPGLTILDLHENKFCCGAAGDYMYMQAKMAQQLRHNKIKELLQLAPTLLLTTNIGCALFLRKGLHQSQQNITVKHPVSLIAEILAKSYTEL